MSRTILVVGACVLALQVAAPGAQQQPQQPVQAPVFRAGTTIVPLSVSVVDRLGVPVTGLTQDDFTVREGDVRQDIRAFFPQALTPRTPPPLTGSTLIRAPRSDPATIAPSTRRTFVIVLGAGRIQPPTNALDGAIGFIREKLLPQDLVAVIGFDRATDFTTDHEQSARVLERYRQRHEAILRAIADFYWCAVCNVDKDLPPKIQADIDAIFAPAPFRSATNLLIPTGAFERDWALPGVTVASLDRPNLAMGRDLLKLYAGIEYLREIDGDKHVIVMSEKGIGASGGNGGGEWGLWENELVAKRANEARVVIDIIHTGGIDVPMGQGGVAMPPRLLGNRDWSISNSQHVTDDTGGQFTGVSYAKDALARIDQATRFGYLLGYTPANTAADDRFRKVKVTVNRPDVVVLFRHGYVAQEDVPPAEAQEQITSDRLAAAAMFKGESQDIKIRATASLVAGIGINRRVFVELAIDAARVSFTEANGRRVARLDVQVYCGDADRRTVGDARETLNLSVDEKAYQKLLKDGIPFRARVPITDIPTDVKVLVYDYGADLLGIAVVKIK